MDLCTKFMNSYRIHIEIRDIYGALTINYRNNKIYAFAKYMRILNVPN